MAKQKRRIKLIEPKLQVQLTMVFVGLSGLALMMQFILFQTALTKFAVSLPNDSSLVMDAQSAILPGIFGVTLLVIMPLTYLVGVLTTFRIAGPVYRLKMYLRSIREDGYQGPCKLRDGDKLVALAAEVSATVAHLVDQTSTEYETSHDSKLDQAA
ncbi:MAG: hypothetical protein ACI8X5_001820 [Planctomycetota bacterium]|jgi:hypothetical protein